MHAHLASPPLPGRGSSRSDVDAATWPARTFTTQRAKILLPFPEMYPTLSLRLCGSHVGGIRGRRSLTVAPQSALPVAIDPHQRQGGTENDRRETEASPILDQTARTQHCCAHHDGASGGGSACKCAEDLHQYDFR